MSRSIEAIKALVANSQWADAIPNDRNDVIPERNQNIFPRKFPHKLPYGTSYLAVSIFTTFSS